MRRSKKMMSLAREALFITFLNILLIAFFWSIIDSTDLFNPLNAIFDDFDYTDLYFNGEYTPDQPTQDSTIVIVNFGFLSRKEVAELLLLIQEQEPKVIGIDAVYKTRKGVEDFFLKRALNSKKNIVVGAIGEYSGDQLTTLHRVNPYFGKNSTTAHLDLRLMPTIAREFDTYVTLNDTVYYSFTAEILRQYDTAKFERFIKRDNKVELINYQLGPNPYLFVDYEDVFEQRLPTSFFKDKIVLLAYLKADKEGTFDLEDTHFTPLNKSQNFNPDVKGIEIHGHILAMMLREDYVYMSSDRVNYLIAFVLTLLFVTLACYLYVYRANYFDFISKLIQLVIIISVLPITLALFHYFRIKIDIIPTVISIIFCLEVLYLYEEVLLLLKINTFLTRPHHFKPEENKIISLWHRSLRFLKIRQR